MKRASPEMLVTGAVGSYLIGSAWASAMFAISGMLSGFGEHQAISLGVGVGLVFVLLWVGGCVCEGIGWIGAARLHGGLAAVIGWAICTLPATYFFIVVVGASIDAPAVLILIGLLEVGLYLCTLVFALRRQNRAVVLPVSFGSVFAILGVLGLMLAVAIKSPVAAVVFSYVGVCGMAITHFALATYFRGAAREVRALDVFV